MKVLGPPSPINTQKQQKLIPIRTISGSDLEHRHVNKYFEGLQK
jgi:hypothetical protein